MEVYIGNVVVSVATSLITVLLVFFVRNFLEEKTQYKKLKKKLESVAGKNAVIVYTGAGELGGTLYKIIEITIEGITIENSVHKIFIPASQVLNLPMILPVDGYEALKNNYEKEQIEKVSGAMFEPLWERLEASMEQTVAEPGSEIGTSIEVRVIGILEERGLLQPTKEE